MASQYTTKCPHCGRRISKGLKKCPYCHKPLTTSVTTLTKPDSTNKSSTSTTWSPTIYFLYFFFLAVMGFFGGKSIGKYLAPPYQPPAYATIPAHTPIPPIIPPSDIKYVVDQCRVEGRGAENFATYKAEVRQGERKGVNWLTQFQTDEGEFIEEKLPSFEGKKFLLFCMPKEIGEKWASQWSVHLFKILGNPINQKGEVDPATIKDGYWIFVNKKLFVPTNNVNNGGKKNYNFPTPTLTPFKPLPPTTTLYPTPTLGPTLPPPTPTPMVEDLNPQLTILERISFEDLAYTRGKGREAWDKCQKAVPINPHFTFRNNPNAAYPNGSILPRPIIEAACPDFNRPRVWVKGVEGVGETYTVYWSASGGGIWIVPGGVMYLGNIGKVQYAWTNSLGVKFYTVGFGFVTLTPVQLFVPTPTPPPPPPPEVTPTPTSRPIRGGCVQLTWQELQDPTTIEAITNEMGSHIMIHNHTAQRWEADNNPEQCFIITDLPTIVINLDDGRKGKWSWSVINLGWLDSAYQNNPFIWKVSNNVWVGMVDPLNE